MGALQARKLVGRGPKEMIFKCFKAYTARAMGRKPCSMSAHSSASPTGYSGIYALTPRIFKLYEALSMPQYASPRELARVGMSSSAAAKNMTAPPTFSENSLASMVSEISGPKLPRYTARALQPAFCTSARACCMWISLSTMHTGHS